MKLKDLVALVLFGVILVVLGSFFVSRVGRSGEPRTAEVEVVYPINPTFNEEARAILLGQNEHTKTTPYSGPANLKAGFGNTKPFGP